MHTLQDGLKQSLHIFPAEIRLRMYEYMTPPIDSRLADWRGLFMSCKQFHYEMKDEFLRSMARYLDQIREQWIKSHVAPLQITKLTQSSDIGRISVAIPNSYFRSLDGQFPATRVLSKAIIPLLQLGVIRLTFTRYEDDEEMKHKGPVMPEGPLADFMSDLRRLMDPKVGNLGKFDDKNESIRTPGSVIDRITFEWGFYGEILHWCAKEYVSDRTIELMRPHICGPPTGVTWIRRPYTWYGQVQAEFWSDTGDLKRRSRSQRL
ncbi:uncharacterized protein CC84DRAFT_1176839 [Paraphaeosphaeria sporulosa]|uniref:Uncharacterized protein n=1 Tax=Paraphaeosphaeria sporulosa TaxID=1460663 RepID=A0A177CBU1_9PLEO|nr:uncharacterized protein CC84DRAFT_1176839 [Paraphaeosphaeria sporulosa]OAG04651.1 hypothetical protein CC84DRAFT_1176839 [Paraphaeosphaeria sporulosa]